MRRTVKNGWVAKAVDTTKGSTVDLMEERGGFDEEELLGSDAGSLDSFFDDDFEDKELGDLLSCNTLGIESKVTITCMHALFYLLISYYMYILSYLS